MKSPLHLNLLKEEERYSSSPIRLRVMLPLLTSLAVFGVFLWWLLLILGVHGQIQLKADLEQTITSLKSSHAAMLSSRAQEQEYQSITQQLNFYIHSKNRYGEALQRLPEEVPASIQFTELRMSPPQPAAPSLSQTQQAPTNTFEQVSLRIAGRTGGDRPSEGVNRLLAALRSPAFTNVFKSAVIPKGAFRLDTMPRSIKRDTLLFEIICECVPREFK